MTQPTPSDPPELDAERVQLEISLPAAMELCQLGLGTMVDIRQLFEIELKGGIPGTVHIPLYEVMQMLGHPLTADEQEALDCGEPADIDARGFFTTINQLHHVRDHIVLIICNSGRRSLYAARMLRNMGYGKALSVGGGFQAWKKLQAQPAQPARSV
ncbi:MAG: rhodanese-like domain-containing protein [Ideonella sp.]|nr:rhodanese-like domain-containing protein [Ideonella sp.]